MLSMNIDAIMKFALTETDLVSSPKDYNLRIRDRTSFQ